jgi:hypothetical protein
VYAGWVQGRRRVPKRELRDGNIYVVWKIVLVIGRIAQEFGSLMENSASAMKFYSEWYH